MGFKGGLQNDGLLSQVLGGLMRSKVFQLNVFLFYVVV